MAECQRLGHELHDIVLADLEARGRQNLANQLSRHPKLRGAYDRGRLLWYLGDLAPKAQIYEAARRLKDLGFAFDSAQGLREFLDADREAGEVWETARVNGWIENRESLRAAAREGNVKAITLLDKLAADRDRETGGTGVSFNRVTYNQMAELLGVTRQTVYDWHSGKGMPQNTDGTFDLCRVMPWYAEYVQKKAVRGKDAISPLNPFQAVKTEHARLQLERDRGELIERGSAIGLQIAMNQNLVNAFNAITDLANRIFSQPREEIVARLEDFRDEVMAKLQHVPADLKLSEAAREKLAELYETIKPQRAQSDTEKGR